MSSTINFHVFYIVSIIVTYLGANITLIFIISCSIKSILYKYLYIFETYYIQIINNMKSKAFPIGS